MKNIINLDQLGFLDYLLKRNKGQKCEPIAEASFDPVFLPLSYYMRCLNWSDVKAKIKEGLRLKGKGVPSLRGGARGDLHVRVMVESPVGLTPEQLELLRKFNASLTPKNLPRRKAFEERARNFLRETEA